MQRHPRSGVLLVSANSKNRAGLLVGAYLLNQGVCSTAIDALSLWSVLRSESHIQSRAISRGVSNKMYQLYLSYFGHFCTTCSDARAAKMPNNVVFTIGRVLISHMCINPTSTLDLTSRPSYELCVFLNGLMYHCARADYNSQESRVSELRILLVALLFAPIGAEINVHCLEMQGSLDFDFSAAGPVDFGDVRFELKRHGCEQSIFSFAFHSGAHCIVCA
jgi:hypothetical protein